MINVRQWTGAEASALRAALRMSTRSFAEYLGVALRTIAKWEKLGTSTIPRPDTQAILDSALLRADAAVQARFETLLADSGINREGSTHVHASGHEPWTEESESPPAHLLRVGIAVVIRESIVLLVRRREDEAPGITWQFPAGVIKPGARTEATAVRETLNETGVHCAPRQILGTRLHPVTGVHCEYVLCDYLAGTAENRDTVENVDVAWIPKASLTRFVPTDRIFPSILAALEIDG